AEVEAARKLFRTRIEALIAEVGDNRAQTNAAVIIRARTESWFEALDRARARPPDQGRAEAILESTGQLSPREVLGLLDSFAGEERSLLDSRLDASQQASLRVTIPVLVVGGAAILIAPVLAIWLSRAILEPVRRLIGALSEIRAGNLEVRVSAGGGD